MKGFEGSSLGFQPGWLGEVWRVVRVVRCVLSFHVKGRPLGIQAGVV